MTNDPQWLAWAKRLAALAQSGLTYVQNPFDRDRYVAVQQIAAEMMSAGTGMPADAVLDILGAEVGHATPKVDVRGVVFQGDNILLVKEREDGRWSLPGGWADVYDSPAGATTREIFEESGYRTRAVKLLALYDRDLQGHPPMAFHAYKVFFLCELLGGQAQTSIETDDVRFFRRDALPDLSVGRVTEAQIRRFYQHHDDPSLPTDFE